MEPALLLICDASALLYWRSVGAGSGPPPRAMRAMRAPGNGNAGKPSPDRIADIPHSPASRSIFSYRVAKPDSAARESGASSMRAHSLPVLFPRSKRTYSCFRPSYAFCAMPPSCLFHTQLNWVLSSAEPTACQLAKREARENALRSRTQPSSSHTSRIAPASEESPKLNAHCDMLKTDRNHRAKRWSLFCSICPLA